MFVLFFFFFGHSFVAIFVSGQNMEREREGMGDFFKGFGSDRRMFTSIFGGRNPFADPFFSRPFGSLFGSGTFGPHAASNTAPERPKEKGVLIEELDSDDEGQEIKENGGGASKSSNEPSVEHPDDEDDGNRVLNCSLLPN